jgi:inner membrane protein
LPLQGPLGRELIVGKNGRYSIDLEIVGDCRLPDLIEARRTNSQLDAFLLWSRTPFAARAADGSVILYDARFYDPRARDRFSVPLPNLRCEELPAH